MKKLTCFFSLVFVLFPFSSCSKITYDYTMLTTEDIVKTVTENAPTEFGYCDVSEYYEKNYFNSIDGLLECRIFTCNESTNFNEFGVFKFSNKKQTSLAKPILNSYITNVKKEFENGIIYNVEEYPKFKNAKVIELGNYLLYTILNKEQTENILFKLNKKG